jgi:hypothetical protein
MMGSGAVLMDVFWVTDQFRIHGEPAACRAFGACRDPACPGSRTTTVKGIKIFSLLGIVYQNSDLCCEQYDEWTSITICSYKPRQSDSYVRNKMRWRSPCLLITEGSRKTRR